MKQLFVRWGLVSSLLAVVSVGGLARAADEDSPRPKNRREQLRQAVQRLEMLRKMIEENQGGALLPEGFDFPLPGLGRGRPQPRLGVLVRSPGEALADQLGLPEDRGIVLAGVTPDSAAARAGLKKNDVLLELGGKPVPSKPAEFARVVAGIKAGTAIDAVVVRKGKKETVKGLTLPEAKAPPALPELGGLDALGLPGLPGLIGGAGAARAPAGEVTTITREGDRFTATRKKGKTILTVTGTVANGKATVGKVVIDDGSSGPKVFDNLDEVPADWKSRVEKLAEMIASGKATRP